MNPTVSVGIAGYGYWGPNLARNFDALAGAKVGAVCDSSPERLGHAQSNLPQSAMFGDFQAMLEQAGLDAVVIATPAKTHHALAKAALLAGKHVMVEKPMATSTAECDDLIRLAEEKGLTLMVGHTFLYSEAVREVIRIIASGEIGEIRYINCQRLNLGLFQKDINVAWDLAPHDLSILLHVMGGLPQIVNCQGHAHINPNVEDVANISLTFAGMRFATVQNSWLEPRKVRQITFVGSHGMIVYDDLEPREKIRVYDVRVDFPKHYEDFAEFQYSYHYGECRIPHLDQKEPLRILASHFIDCIHRQSRPDSCGARGREVVRVLEACSESLRGQGCPVYL